MTLRIERRRSGDTLIVQLIGEFDNEHLDEVKAQVCDAPCPVVVDLRFDLVKVFDIELADQLNDQRIS